MTVWKKIKGRSLVTGKETFVMKMKRIDTPLIAVFRDFEWWKWFCGKNQEWIMDNRDCLPDEIKREIPKEKVFSLIQHDSRYRGHVFL